MSATQARDPDATKGAVEATRPEEASDGNASAPALDEQGLPADPVAIAQDRVGANEDETQG